MMEQKHYFIFNGYDSRDFGLYISGGSTHIAPPRRYEVTEIPGKNGDVFDDKGSYENVHVIYRSSWISEDFEANYTRLKAALLSEPGYHILRDSYHPDEYRVAVFNSGIQPSMTSNMEFGAFDIDFTCMPQRYAIDGNEAINLPATFSPKTVVNFSEFNSTWQSRIGILVKNPSDIKYAIYDFTQISLPEGTMTNPKVKLEYFGMTEFTHAKNAESYFGFTNNYDPKTSTAIAGAMIRNDFVCIGRRLPKYVILPYTAGLIATLVEGDKKTVIYNSVGSPNVVENRYAFSCFPVIKIDIDHTKTPADLDSLLVSINGTSIGFKGYTPTTIDTITIDGETMNAYSEADDNSSLVLLNLNNTIKMESQIVLKPGVNNIYVTDVLGPIRIIPRWWRL